MNAPTTNHRVSIDTLPWKLEREAFLQQLSARIDQGLGGIDAAGELSAWLDDQLSKLRDGLDGLVPRVPMALYATGSYGRGWLAPASDVDLLVLYHADQTDQHDLAEVIGALQTALRDIGYRVGMAARTPDECRSFADADLTVAASMLDARLLWRSADLGPLPFGEPERLSAWVVEQLRRHAHGRPFASQIRQGCSDRHRRYGQTVYRLEPNIKQGRGGLRDVQALLWSGHVLHGARTLDEVSTTAGVDDETREAFRAAADFVFKARIALHLEAGRFANDRMTFMLQEKIAARFADSAESNEPDGPDRPLPVERFMQRYYQASETVASEALGWLDIWLLPEPETHPPVGVLPGICLRQGHLDLVRADDHFARGTVLPTPGQAEITDLDEVTVGTAAAALARTARKVLEGNPLRLHELAMELELPIHPVADAHLKRAAATLSSTAACSTEVTGSLLRVLTSLSASFRVVRSLATSGLLYVVLPEFEPVRALAQHDVYHEYTVDAHLLKALEELKALLRGDGAATGHQGRFVSLGATLGSHRHRALLLAGLLHDVGKGRGRDHSELGAELGREIGSRVGLTEVEIDRLAFLIRHHLLLAKVSQRRDLTDDDVIWQVALTVRNVQSLEDLVLLTAADMRALGPQRFTEWKAHLLAELYERVRHALEEGIDVKWQMVEARRAISVETRAALMASDGDHAEAEAATEELEAFLGEMPERYLLSTTPARLAEHFKLARPGAGVAVQFHSDPGAHFTELLVSTNDRPGTLATLAGVLSAHGINILTAEIVTMASSRTLDVFRVVTDAGGQLDHPAKLNRVHRALKKALEGDLDVGALIRERRADQPADPAMPGVPTVVSVDQEASGRYTVVEIKTRDRIGLLWEITNALFSQGCTVALSRIVTEGLRVIDVFYVEDAEEARKLTDAEAAALGATLSGALSPTAGQHR